ncbi:MAG: putative toxin-antitoxin system toxin component, PIN family [Lachnospiraceae bacterium]|nr:putative toxin-antitoxin system toxin component, PIN family [Lachnospiraceae bacterium]
MKCYAVIDTNVLVSALLSRDEESATVQVITKMLTGEIIPIYSSIIAKEYRDVLIRRKFGLSQEKVDYLIDAIERFGVSVEPTSSGIQLPDMSDVPFYEVVLEKRSDNAYLVTGNKRHFPKEPFVVTPRELLNIIG